MDYDVKIWEKIHPVYAWYDQKTLREKNIHPMCIEITYNIHDFTSCV